MKIESPSQSIEFQAKEQESVEPKKDFHFKEIAEVEKTMTFLVEQMKEKIENGEYDTLISDDVGGRITTLTLRKIMKKINPLKKLETFFIASGKNYLPTDYNTAREKDYQELEVHLADVASKTKKALIITQFVFTGKTLCKLMDALRDAGIQDFDIAALDAMPHFELEDFVKSELGKNNLFIGSREHHEMHEKHEKMSGVRKLKKYRPYPQKESEVILADGRNLSMEEWKEIFKIKDSDSFKVKDQKNRDKKSNEKYNVKMFDPLTPEEKLQIQKNVNFAREDVSLLADKVVEQVWGEKKNK